MLANFSNLITFSRGSNATVTDASGRLTYAANNLVTNSQDFEAAVWTKNNVSVTANSTAAPDGTTTADFVVPNTTGGVAHNIYASVTVAAVPYVLSIYAKSGGYSAVKVGNLFTGVGASFNLATGTVHSTDAGITASITAAGNGWYRCAVAFVASAGSTLYGAYVQSPVGTNSFAGDGTSGVYLWGAQLEAVTYQTTPSPYVSTSVANLLGFSEDFTNAAWTKSNSSIVPNAAQNPINNLWNAQKLMENTTTGIRSTSQNVSVIANTPYVGSVYVKSAGRTWCALELGSLFGFAFAYFNLVTGEFGATNNSPTLSATSVGNGWWRISIGKAPTTSGSTSFSVYMSAVNGTASYTGDGNSGIYIYGAQLSNSGSLDPYVPTPGAAPSSTAYYGPRFDYDPVTLAAKGILIEEQRTNLVLTSAFQTLAGSAGSQYPSGSGWSNLFNTGGTRTYVPSSVFSGGQAVDISSVSAARNVIAFSFTPAASTTYTVSFYIESVSGATGVVAYTTGSLGTGGTTNNVSAPTTTGRYTYTFTTGTTPGSVDLRFGIGCATNESGSIRISNVQCEAGAFATSYIPTVASQVTRTADVASISGSLFNGWYNQDQGTITFKGTSLTVSGFSYAALANDTTNNNRFGMYRSSAVFSGLVVSGGVTQMDIAASSATANVPFKMATTAQANNGNFCFNNVLGTTDTSVTMPTVTRLDIGCFGSGSQFNGHIQSIRYIPNAVSNAQLQSATT